MKINKKRIVADEEIIDAPVADEGAEAEVEIAPEATDLLFEAADVAELVAEVTGDAVEVAVAEDGNSVTFTVGDSEYTVESEGDEEILESVRKPVRNKAVVTASRRPAARVIKKFPRK